MTNASNELALSLEELRELARGIHPAVLDHGLTGRSRRWPATHGADLARCEGGEDLPSRSSSRPTS